MRGRGDGGVGPNDDLFGEGIAQPEEQVLSDCKAEGLPGVRELKAEDPGVRGDGLLRMKHRLGPRLRFEENRFGLDGVFLVSSFVAAFGAEKEHGSWVEGADVVDLHHAFCCFGVFEMVG